MSRTRSLLPLLGLTAVLAFSLVTVARAAGVPASAYQDLRWRLLGPFRAGWSTSADGIPSEPDTFFFGAADGGVWKTTDDGGTWQSISDHAPFSTVGSLAVAAGHPQTIVVGTGEPAPRYDIVAGNGVWRTDDGGGSWRSLGLADTHYVGRVLIDPRDPNVILVAALGHVFGPSSERGVFRTQDGGATWTKVLYRDERTGAVELASDPAHPDVVYAALWEVERWPWQDYFQPAVGRGSGIWKSEDGGRTWKPVGGKGLPAAPLGRIGLAVAPATGAARVYATIDAEHGGGFFRSDDGGATWRQMSGDRALATWYFSRVTVDPKNPDVVWVPGQSLRRSSDGGRTWTIVKGAPGGDDYHYLWINPAQPSRMAVTGDQGTAVTVNGGATWSPWYNQPTGQFYYVRADERFPYWVYSGQQDSGTAGLATRGNDGQLTFREWHPVGGDERDYDIPDPRDPDIVYGSGLGGRLARYDARTGRVENVSPWPISSYARRPTTVKYRGTWFSPIAISARPSHALYQGAQVLFRSLDGGWRWEVVSPDLTGQKPGTKGCEGAVPVSLATACGYGVIYSIAPSPVVDGLVWIGTDNGRVQVTRDDGKTWKDVTPPAVADWSKIAAVEASPTDPGTAYVAVDRHRLDDLRPYAFRTHDFGATWTAIGPGLEGYVNVVRQDPRRPELLYAATRLGVYVSFDDGDHWQSLRQNLPATGVNDLIVHGNDLVLATQGRGLWVMDDASPLRALDVASLAAPAALLPPATAIRLRKNENRDTPLPPEVPAAPNPPTGAVIDFELPSPAAGPVSLTIRDERGAVVRRFSSDRAPERPEAFRYFAEEWLQPPAALPARPGHNRFVWNLRAERPPSPQYEYSIAAVRGEDTPALPEGPLVLPGRYRVELGVGGKTLTQPLTVELDPRVKIDRQSLEAQWALEQRAIGVLQRATEAARALARVDEAIGRAAAAPRSAASAKALALRPELARFHAGGSDDVSSQAEVLAGIEADLEAADGPPTAPQMAVVEDEARRLDAALPAWRQFLERRWTPVEKGLRTAGVVTASE